MGAWACDASCFSNNPNPDLQAGLGELEIKAEPIRFVTCATSDLLQDAAFNVESWLLEKVSLGMRATINEAIVIGSGIGRPLGLLSPSAGIPICDVSEATPAGQFSWQDLMQLKFELPMQWHPHFLFDEPAHSRVVVDHGRRFQERLRANVAAADAAIGKLNAERAGCTRR